jgi:hypothetical protein
MIGGEVNKRRIGRACCGWVFVLGEGDGLTARVK